MRPSKEYYFMQMAELTATRSTCSRLHVGTIITNEEMDHVDSIGYNGNAKGLHNGCESEVPGHCGCLHSENNAIAKANYSIKRKNMFITHLPCRNCAKLIINHGIKSVYFKNLYRDASSIELFLQTGVNIFKLNEETKTFIQIGEVGKT